MHPQVDCAPGEGGEDHVRARKPNVWLEAEIGGGATGDGVVPGRVVVPVEPRLAVASESADGVAECGQAVSDAAAGLAGAAGHENGHDATMALR